MEDSFQNSNPQPSGKNKLKLWITTGGVFVILIISAAGYFYWQYNTTDHLINLAPVDSILYATARNSIWPWEKEKIADLPFENYYQQADSNFPFTDVNLKNDLLANSQQAALVLILNEELRLDSIFLFQLRNPETLNPVLSNLPNYLLLDKNILVVATSQSALDKINQVFNASIFSLATQVDLKKMGRSLMSLYLDADNLKFYLNQSEDLPNKIFSHLVKQDIYLFFNRKGNQWRFKLAGDNLSSAPVSQVLTEYLPGDFSIYASQVNLSQIFASFRQADPVFEFFKQTADSLKTIYNFDITAGLEFLNQPADLIIFNQKDASALGFDYVLVLSQLPEEQINNFEELIKIILAQKFPRRATHLLPDGTEVIELIAEPEAWQWQEDESGIIYLKEPALNFEISYLMKDGKTMVSSSVELLQNFVSTQDIALNNLISQCNEQGNYLIFNSDNISIPNIYLPKGTTLLREDDRGRVNGCIINF